jgi:hypothetical protein
MKKRDSSEKNSEKKQLSELSILGAITECGVLKMDVTNIAYLLADKTDKKALLQSLNDPESEEYEAYHRGLAKGKYDIAMSLRASAELGYNDSCHALSEEQKHTAVAQKIRENFGLES